jgi:CheY-like chemotaxis protein
MKDVLVIDDEPGIADLVSWCLDPLGVRVLLATGRESACQVARDAKVGLVLLDIGLDGEDGLEILPDLKQEPSLSGVPFVAFSAHDSRRREAFRRGVVSFIARPFESADLYSVVRDHLAN